MSIEKVAGIAIVAFLVLFALPGCQTMTTKATSTGPDGSSQILSQKCSTGPFGKLAEGSGTMQTELTKDGGYKVMTGQAAKGVDMATGQNAALTSVTGLVSQLGGAYFSYLSTVPPDVPKMGFMEFVTELMKLQSGVKP
jgi:hypothetical protein